MPRPRAFDEQVVLDQVTDLFWARGYGATSVADLEEATGLGRQSLYATFGDKRELFLKALERYAERNATVAVPALVAGEGGLAALRRYMHGAVHMLTSAANPSSCLVVNTILELGERDPDVSSCCQSSMHTLQHGLIGALSSARQAGELAPKVEIDALSRILLAQLYGLSVLAKNGVSGDDLHRSVDAMVEQLHG